MTSQIPIVDLHCHFIPGIDDGPATMDEALAMARMAVENGITHAVATPHLHPGRWENTHDAALPQFQSFKAEVESAGIPLELGLACEARLDSELLDHLAKGQLPFLGSLGEYKVMLLEFPHGQVPVGADRFAQKMLDSGIRPIIAHPERNREVMRNREKLRAFEDMGCLFQITAGSLLGKFGDAAEELAFTLLESPSCFLIASDAHNTKVRIPELSTAQEVAASVIGEKNAMALISDNPWQIAKEHFVTGETGNISTGAQAKPQKTHAPAQRSKKPDNAATPNKPAAAESKSDNAQLSATKGSSLNLKLRVDFVERLVQHLPVEALEGLAEYMHRLAQQKKSTPHPDKESDTK